MQCYFLVKKGISLYVKCISWSKKSGEEMFKTVENGIRTLQSVSPFQTSIYLIQTVNY